MRHTILPLCAILLGLAPTRATAGEDGWRPYAVREEVSARAWSTGDDRGGLVLGLAGRGDEGLDGRWVREVEVEPERTYAFRAEWRAEGVAHPARSVLARIVWLDATARPLRPMEYPMRAAQAPGDGWSAFEGRHRVPARVTRARLELHLRWTADGRVFWRRVAFAPAAPGARRLVRLATVHHRPRDTGSAAESLARFVPLVEQAASRGADIVCLPEGLTAAGNGLAYAEAAETIPGPSTAALGALAARLRIWIVAGLYERESTRLYNTAVLVGRDGALAGRYRKLSLPDEEIDGGLAPGKETPVFVTDFGTVGLMICWDSSYPEVARALASRGAEVLLMPIAGGEETLVAARAIENQVHVVASGYDFRSGIFDRRGNRIADARSDPDVLVAEVDLGERVHWPWLGEWRARIGREGPAWSLPR